MNIENNNNLTNKNTISVKIGNIKYNLSTNENEEYINGIVKYINNKMDELSSIYDTLNKNSTSFLLVLALNIADDLFKQRQEFNKATKTMSQFENTISSLTNQLTDTKNNTQTLQASNDSKEETISFLEDKLKKLDTVLSEKDKIIFNLKQSLEEKNLIIDNLNKTTTTLSSNNTEDIILEKDIRILELEEEIEKLKARINN